MIRERADDLKDYTVKFTIKYQTSPGQNIYVLGSIDQLGNWRRNAFKLKWSEGHIWKGKLNLSKNISGFEYKFVCASDDQTYKRWEEGSNRVFEFDENLLNAKNQIKLECKWETFFVEFNIYYPLKNDYEYMQIVGGAKGIGNWLLDNGLPCKMKLSEPKTIGPITGRFWTALIEMSVLDQKNYKFEYRYSVFNPIKKSAIWEREPNRKFEILPNSQREISSASQDKIYERNPNKESEFILNNFIMRLDINFVADLVFHKIGEYPIYIGPYPQHEEDIEKIHESGITAILNLQTDQDMNHRQVNWETNCSHYRKRKIEPYRFPIQDFNRRDLSEKLAEAGVLLKNLVSKMHKVYVHCTAGMSRAAATVIAYLVLTGKFNVIDAHDYVKSHRPIICPDIAAIKLAVEPEGSADIPGNIANDDFYYFKITQ